MSTEFLYREKDCSACGMGSYSPQPPGGFMSDPQALRLERLQWLTTSAANRQVLIGNTMNSLVLSCDVPRACGAKQRIYGVDTVRSGALEELAFAPKNAAPYLMAFGHSFSMKFQAG